jgi:RHS repeat-associated protein
VNYFYDNDNRVTRISQAPSNVGFTYDSDSRRTSLTLPNGITTSYNYDVASQLLGINYQLGNSLLGNLAYKYDLAGRRTTVGGSYAQTGLPSALASASCNADNQLTLFGFYSLTYDANGNLTSDGTHTYTWDARNHLVSISGAVSAAFAYDPFGRRVSKSVGPGTTNYLYDGPNPVQELSGGSPTANLLTGLGVDEYFQRTDANGPANFLTDALGSTIALTGLGGSALVQYTYDPYGNTTVTGSSSNPYQYTGRENDGTGLYYYRARYYSPQLQRFISEDPLGLKGGINFYSYVLSNPIGFSDPQGTCPPTGDSVTSYHVNCQKAAIAGKQLLKDLCGCHCGYAEVAFPDYQTCINVCSDCYVGKQPSWYDTCKCVCKQLSGQTKEQCDIICFGAKKLPPKIPWEWK